MSFHLAQLSRFLQPAQVAEAPVVLGNASRYEVRHEPEKVGAGASYWRVAGVYHLSPDENRGKHAVYVDVVDENGQRVRDPGVRLVWGWEGQQSGQRSDPKAFDKPDNEPATNVDLYLGQKTWVKVEGGGLSSDRVSNLHSNHPDEPGPNGDLWNSIGHHSYYVLFQRARSQSATTDAIQTGVHTTPNGSNGSNGGSPDVFIPAVERPEVKGGSVRVADKLGIDANQPVDEASGNIAAQVADPHIIAATGVGWVRLNFIVRGRWQSPNDSHWQQTYRRIIKGFRGQNLRIYGLISAQAVPNDPDFFRHSPDDGAAQHEWIDRYAENFATIVRLFHDDVDVFESFNEPDNWQKWEDNWIHADWFAVMLQAIHDRVRADPALRHVKIVSGPLQGLHNNNNNGVNYLRNTYVAGRKRFGWGENGKPFPFDGVGYHLYVAQDSNSSVEQIRKDYRRYMTELRNVIKQEEGKLKPIYLSEFGWFSNGGNEDFQARSMQAGLDEAINDDSLALVIWFGTQDFYGDNDGHYFGVYHKGALTADNRKLCFHTLNSIATSKREVAVSGVGQPVGTVPATGPKPEAQPERQPELQPETAAPPSTPLWSGKVNAPSGLFLREGPGQGFRNLAGLVDGSLLQVLGETNGWLLVESSLGLGYVSAQYVMRADQATAQITPEDRILLDAWTRYRDLIAQESARLKIDPGVAVAVLLTESGGTAFRNGRMVIRFENHIFHERWGQQNPDRFNQHFTYNQNKKWTGHQWRPDASQPLRTCHSSQDEEWAVFEFARHLDEAAAIRSISMGAPQIMGFNHQAIGYNTPRAMFDAFQASAETQVRGMFRFIESKNLVGALRSGDYLSFAIGYNGSGQPEYYVGLIRTYLESFRRTVGDGVLRAAATTEGAVGRGVRPVQPTMEATAIQRLPQPVPDRELADADPELYEAWRKHIEQGFINNQTMFEEILKGFMNPYWTTVLMYRILFGVGILGFVAAVVMAIAFQGNPAAAIGTSAVFGGLGIAAFVGYFLSRPMQALEENLQFITWLGVIYNSYWTKMAYIRKQSTVQEEIDQATISTIDRLKELIEKHAAMRAIRPGLK